MNTVHYLSCRPIHEVVIGLQVQFLDTSHHFKTEINIWIKPLGSQLQGSHPLSSSAFKPNVFPRHRLQTRPFTLSLHTH